MRIGLFPIAAKPYHLGHHLVMQKASQECDKVILIVSLLDRDNILGVDMALVWRDHIIPKLPDNVSTVFLESSPVARVYQILKLREADYTSDYKFRIYSDNEDIKKNYSLNSLINACPMIAETDVVECVGVPRNETVNISGTQMRHFIREGDFNSFASFMPEDTDNKAIFEILATLHK